MTRSLLKPAAEGVAGRCAVSASPGTFAETPNLRPGPEESERTLHSDESPGPPVGTEGSGSTDKTYHSEAGAPEASRGHGDRYSCHRLAVRALRRIKVMAVVSPSQNLFLPIAPFLRLSNSFCSFVLNELLSLPILISTACFS